MKETQLVHGFELLDQSDVPELNAKGLWYKHQKTGLQVYHLLTDDEENLFSFAFKTPPKDSTGVAHILEHSVLCGSKNFPLKDPFLQLANQSVKTFLNAMTFPDKTVYPASSMIEADYFNLFAVYGDAVFFPLLDEWTFKQEGHRLEVDEKGQLALQGVVYNEMKGNYSSLDSIAGDWSLRSLMQGSVYGVDSGGDPECIPDLTYEEFKNFHRTYYSPANCRLFLYGNIPTEKQLAFVEERFLKDFVDENEHLHRAPDIEVLPPFKKAQTVEVSAPAGEAKTGSTVLINWALGDASDALSSMEYAFMAEILLGHDGAPLSRALVQCGLGEDISPITGLESEIRQACLSVGLRGMKKKDAPKLEKVIFDVLQDLAVNGIPQQEINAALMSLEFANREVRRSGGPFSLVLMRRSLRGWLHGQRPDATLINSRSFASVKEKIAADTTYLQGLIKKMLIDNPHRTVLIVNPDKNYDKKLQERLNQRLDGVLSGKTPAEKEAFLQKLKQDQEILLKKQQETDSPEKLALIPHLKPSQLSTTIDRILTERKMLGNVPLFLHNEATNGIVYIELGIPVDTLEPADYLFLPFFASSVSSVGFKGLDWVSASAWAAQVTGGLGASIFSSSISCDVPQEQKDLLMANDPVLGRSWLFFRIKMLEEKLPEALDVLFSVIKTADFSDIDRLKDLTMELRNDYTASIIPAGHQYAASRCSFAASRSKAIDEIWNGLTQLYFMHDIAEMEVSELSQKLIDIQAALNKAGMVINCTAQESGLKKFSEALVSYVQAEPPLQRPFDCSDQDFYTLAQLVDSDLSLGDSDNDPEIYTGPMQVGFAAAAFPASGVDTNEAVYESLFGHWITNNLLWEQIRTIGGAYGAFAYTDSLEKCFTMATYRDPCPEKSLQVFEDCLQRAADTPIAPIDLEKTITGTYSKTVQPRSPANRGFTGFVRNLYGITDEQRERNMKALIQATPEALHSTAKRLYEGIKKSKKTLFCEKTTKKTGKIKCLPL